MSTALRFGRFELRSDECQPLDDGRAVFLSAQAFDLLMLLVQHRARILSKNELLDTVWPGLVVKEANVQVQVSALPGGAGRGRAAARLRHRISPSTWWPTARAC